jgi:hypothetical protein
MAPRSGALQSTSDKRRKPFLTQKIAMQRAGMPMKTDAENSPEIRRKQT